MDYNYIESLVIKAKDGDIISKEKLCEEFTPYILNLCKKTFIYGYDFCDIKSECYKYLYKCLSYYNTSSHKFVAYATIGIKNNLNDLIRKNLNNSNVNAAIPYSHDDYTFTSITSNINIEETLCQGIEKDELKKALTLLSNNEKELIDDVYFSNNSIRKYAKKKNIKYNEALKQNKQALMKIAHYFCDKKLMYF